MKIWLRQFKMLIKIARLTSLGSAKGRGKQEESHDEYLKKKLNI
jgi:hypothetical protein